MAETFYLRFLKDGNPADIQITENELNENRLHTRESAIVKPLVGTATGLLQEASALAYDVPAAVGTYVYGYYATGNTDAYFELELNGIVIAESDINILRRKSNEKLWPPFYVSAGQDIKLRVTNKGAQTGDFRAIIYIEEVA